MKKSLCVLGAICIFAVVLTACTSEPNSPKNLVSPKELTQDQQDIVDLLSSDNQEILLFDYKTEGAYKSMEFWVEIYENGELIDRPSGINSYSDEANPLDGQLAVLINHDTEVIWTFTASENGSRISNTGEIAAIDSNGLGRGYGQISDPVEIEPGKEIVLYTSIYSASGITSFSDQQRYVEELELLSQYPYVHIIKCRFE